MPQGLFCKSANLFVRDNGCFAKIRIISKLNEFMQYKSSVGKGFLVFLFSI